MPRAFRSHHVSVVSNDDEPEPRWVLFNDFAVREVTDEEALDFDPDWKVRIEASATSDVDSDTLSTDASSHHARKDQQPRITLA